MRSSSEVLSDEAIAAVLGDDTFARTERGLERLWDAIWTDTSDVARCPHHGRGGHGTGRC